MVRLVSARDTVSVVLRSDEHHHALDFRFAIMQAAAELGLDCEIGAIAKVTQDGGLAIEVRLHGARVADAERLATEVA